MKLAIVYTIIGVILLNVICGQFNMKSIIISIIISIAMTAIIGIVRKTVRREL
jgi:hypothetical protein